MITWRVRAHNNAILPTTVHIEQIPVTPEHAGALRRTRPRRTRPGHRVGGQEMADALIEHVLGEDMSGLIGHDGVAVRAAGAPRAPAPTTRTLSPRQRLHGDIGQPHRPDARDGRQVYRTSRSRLEDEVSADVLTLVSHCPRGLPRGLLAGSRCRGAGDCTGEPSHPGRLNSPMSSTSFGHANS
jgi:hypothetical protein